MLSKVLVVAVMEEVASKMGYSKLTSTAKRSSVVLFWKAVTLLLAFLGSRNLGASRCFQAR